MNQLEDRPSNAMIRELDEWVLQQVTALRRRHRRAYPDISTPTPLTASDFYTMVHTFIENWERRYRTRLSLAVQKELVKTVMRQGAVLFYAEKWHPNLGLGALTNPYPQSQYENTATAINDTVADFFLGNHLQDVIFDARFRAEVEADAMQTVMNLFHHVITQEDERIRQRDANRAQSGLRAKGSKTGKPRATTKKKTVVKKTKKLCKKPCNRH